MKITVVTAITAGKDQLRDQPVFADVEYIAFVEKSQKHPQWQTRIACNKFVDPVMNAKIHKILTHLYVSAPIIVWMDGNMRLKQDPHKLAEVMGDKNFAFFNHHARADVYKEIRTCLKVKRGNPQDLLEQQQVYLDMGFPRNTGLAECPAFVRRNNPVANQIFEKWWAQICRFSSRDQVSFPFAFADQDRAQIPGKIFSLEENENEFFEHTKHKF